jgi:hypothetical protein
MVNVSLFLTALFGLYVKATVGTVLSIVNVRLVGVAALSPPAF